MISPVVTQHSSGSLAANWELLLHPSPSAQLRTQHHVTRAKCTPHCTVHSTLLFLHNSPLLWICFLTFTSFDDDPFGNYSELTALDWWLVRHLLPGLPLVATWPGPPWSPLAPLLPVWWPMVRGILSRVRYERLCKIKGRRVSLWHRIVLNFKSPWSCKMLCSLTVFCFDKK